MHRPQRAFRPALESLERRDVPATTTVLTNLTGSTLTIEGTEYADKINVSYSAGTVRVQASTAATGTSINQTFNAASTGLFVVAGEGGNDTIVIEESIGVGTRLFGGWGNDALYGGSGPDVMFGGSGNDSLNGRRGDDVAFGDGGWDYLDGGSGANSMMQDSFLRTYYVNNLELEVVRLVNVERARVGLPALSLSSLLAKAAKLHATQMAQRSNLSGPAAGMQHTLYGTTLPTIASRADYVGYQNATAWGENIAYGYTTAAQVVAGWMSSPGHRANILSASFKEIGVGTWTDAAGRVFWAQTFGAR